MGLLLKQTEHERRLLEEKEKQFDKRADGIMKLTSELYSMALKCENCKRILEQARATMDLFEYGHRIVRLPDPVMDKY